MLSSEKFAQVIPGEKATRPNETWCVELVRFDSPGRPIILIALDVFSGKPVALELTFKTAGDVTARLERAAQRSGYHSF